MNHQLVKHQLAMLGLLLLVACSPRPDSGAHSCPKGDPSTPRSGGVSQRKFENLLDTLADRSATPGERRTAWHDLLTCEDVAVVPALISRLNDSSPYNLGLDENGNLVEMNNGTTIGVVCEQLLNAILRPNPHESLRIADYETWWKKNCNESLEEMRNGLRRK